VRACMRACVLVRVCARVRACVCFLVTKWLFEFLHFVNYYMTLTL